MVVLIVDSDKFTRTIYESELHQQNFIVELAEDGAIGWEKAKKLKPDLILMDLILPRKNGFDVLKELKNDPETKNIPVIVSSSLSQKEDIDEVLELGALSYFPKEYYSQKQIIKEALNILSAIMIGIKK